MTDDPRCDSCRTLLYYTEFDGWHCLNCGRAEDHLSW